MILPCPPLFAGAIESVGSILPEQSYFFRKALARNLRQFCHLIIFREAEEMKQVCDMKRSQRESVGDRLERHPELKARMEQILDLVENVSGEIRRADDAESRAIEMLRQMGQQVLQGWGERQAEKEADALEAAHKVIRQGKKNSTGTVASEE